MQPIGYILWTQAHIAEPLENPSLHSLPLSLSLFYIFYYHQIQVFYMVSEPQSSNEQLNPSASAFQKKKKKPSKKLLTTNLSFFRKLINKISPSLQNRQKPCYLIRIQACTRSHARPIASENLRSLHRVAGTTKFQIYYTQAPINKEETTNQQSSGRSTHRHKNQADPMYDAPSRATGSSCHPIHSPQSQHAPHVPLASSCHVSIIEWSHANYC